MDAKITKERLSRMLSYDWLKIVGGILAAILVWSLIFTMSATRITPAQQFTAINYFGNVGTINTNFSGTLISAQNKGIFSYEVIETTEVDVGGNQEYGSTLMETHIATSEGDVVFVPNIPNEGYKYERDGEEVYDTYLQSLVRGYSYCLMNLDRDDEEGFFMQMERYLNHYFTGGYKTGVLNEETVREDFLNRIEENKDKRYKKKDAIEKGVKDDVARIQKYRDALVEFDGYLASGLVQLETTTVWDYDNNKLFLEGVYSINLCPNNETMPNLKNIAAYMKTVEGEEGEQQNVLCADNMHVGLLTFDDVEEGFEYESLLYVNYVIRLSMKAEE
jgi:hypothetical protein